MNSNINAEPQIAANSALDTATIAQNTILYASLAIMLATIVARVAGFFAGIDVDNTTYVLLFIGTGFALFFLRFNQLQYGAWAFLIGTLAAMFNNSFTGSQGAMLAVTGYVIALVLAIMILPGQQWRLVLLAVVVSTVSTAITRYFALRPSPEANAQLGLGVMQLCYIFVAAIAVGYLYSGVVRLIEQLQQKNVALNKLEHEQRIREQELAATNQRLNLISDNIPVSIVYFDKSETITYGNRAFNQYYKLAGELPLGVEDALKEDYARCKPYIDRCLTGELIEFEIEHQGQFKGLFANITYIPHEVDGVIEGVIVLAANITARRQAEDALREKSDLLEIITNNLPARINYTDRNHVIKFVNHAFAEKYNLDVDQVPFNHSIMDTGVRRLTNLRNENSDVEARVLSGESLSFEWADADDKAMCKTSHVKMVPHIIDDEVVGYISLALDISEQKQSARALHDQTELLKIITTNLPVRIAYFDNDNNMLFHNKAFSDGFRHRLNPAYRNSADLTRFIDHVDNDETRRSRQPYYDAVLQGQYVKFESETTCANGNPEILQTTYVPHIEAGKVVGRVSLAVDITQLRQTQQSLQENIARFDLVINNVPARIAYVDKRNTLIFVNDRIESDFNLSVADVIGRNAEDVFPQPYFDLLTPYVRQVAATKQNLVFDAPVTLHDGTNIIERTYIYPHIIDGIVEALFMLHMDITEVKKTEDSLNNAQKLESLGVLAGGIAHDFNNLLVAMLGQSSLALAKIEETHKARRHIKQSVAAAERAATLTKQMLAYSGRGSFAIGKIDLNDVITSNLKLFEVSLPKNVKLVTNLAKKLPLIQADDAQIQQLIMNLIINAGQAIGTKNGEIAIQTSVEHVTPDNGEFWEITGDSLVPGQYASIQIKDDGIGMDDETKSKIFDPFYTTKDAGSGLGLAAALGIIRGHKGGIRVYSEPGNGTVFHLLFPIYAPTHIESIKEKRARLNSAETGQTHTILVIDDEASVVRAVSDMLDMKGFKTIQCTRGQDGLTKYQQHQDEIALVLLDLMMPDMNGEAVFKGLQEINPNVRVMLSSGYSEAEVTRQFVGQNLADFIQKPYDFQTLVNKVVTLLKPAPI